MVNKKSSGFTLVELLITITVLAILSGVLLTLINVNGIRSKARDSQRKADLSKIQTALESYFADHQQYPSGRQDCASSQNPGFMCITGSDLTSQALNGYMDKVPVDPLYPSATSLCDGNDPTTAGPYTYYAPLDGSKYVLATQMENPLSNSDPNWCGNVGPALGNPGMFCEVNPANDPVNCYAVSSPIY